MLNNNKYILFTIFIFVIFTFIGFSNVYSQNNSSCDSTDKCCVKSNPEVKKESNQGKCCRSETKIDYNSSSDVSTVCPVSGESVSGKDFKLIYNNKEYIFCCSGCKAKFEINPENYIK